MVSGIGGAGMRRTPQDLYKKEGTDDSGGIIQTKLQTTVTPSGNK